MYLVPFEKLCAVSGNTASLPRTITFKTIPNLQLKLCTLYVVHFLPVLDFRAALNPSIVSADAILAVILAGS